MPEIRFSIVLACYNQRHFVKAAVESALSQPHPAKEVIVVDDASSDGTQDVLDTFGDAIHLVKSPKNQGTSLTRNHGASLAKGEYLVFLDGDDVLMPWTLQVCERLIEAEHPKIILGRRLYFEGEVPAVQRAPTTIEFVNYACWYEKDRTVSFGASNFVVDRKAFWDVGGWSPELFHLDIEDLMLRLGVAGKTLVVLAPETVWYRLHQTNAVRAVQKFMPASRVLLRREKTGQYPGGREYVFARATCLGGPILFWILQALKTGSYIEGLRLAGSAWFTILAATLRRFVALLGGRRPTESMALSK